MKTISTALLTTLACVAAGCSSQEDSMVVVSVDAPNSVATAYYLRVNLQNSGDPDYRQFPIGKANLPFTFPTSFGLHVPRDRKGVLTVKIDALDESTEKVLASGTGTVEINVGERMDLCVGLIPKCTDTTTSSPSTLDGGSTTANPTTSPETGTATRGGLPAGLRFARVATGTDHSCAVAIDGSLWCWGGNAMGQLGLGDTQDSLLPMRVAGTSWSDVTAGYLLTCAMQSASALSCWGNNGSGQVGNGTAKANGFVAIPLPIEGSWLGASTGSYHVMALQSDGALFSWGNNSSDQLGDSSVPSAGRSSPGPVNSSTWLTAAGFTFAAGNLHSCAVDSQHRLWCWGDNSKGQLGDGTTHMRLSPTQIPGNDWAQISGGYYHTCALKTDGSLWCWGDNSKGQLGIGSTADQQTPAPVTMPGTRWTAISTGHSHACGLQSDGSLWCWGDNTDGQCGTGQATNAPSRLTSAAPSWKSMSAGDGHTCAIAADGALWCWGRNRAGQVGNGNSNNQATPALLGS